MKIINIICLLIWLYWLVYAIFGSNKVVLKGGLICSSLVCISYYIQLVLGQLK